jgi:hypothetical protein
MRHEVVVHRRGTPLGEPLVAVGVAAGIGVAFDLNAESLVVLQGLHDLVEGRV